MRLGKMTTLTEVRFKPPRRMTPWNARLPCRSTSSQPPSST